MINIINNIKSLTEKVCSGVKIVILSKTQSSIWEYVCQLTNLQNFLPIAIDSNKDKNTGFQSHTNVSRH